MDALFFRRPVGAEVPTPRGQGWLAGIGCGPSSCLALSSATRHKLWDGDGGVLTRERVKRLERRLFGWAWPLGAGGWALAATFLIISSPARVLVVWKRSNNVEHYCETYIDRSTFVQ